MGNKDKTRKRRSRGPWQKFYEKKAFMENRFTSPSNSTNNYPSVQQQLRLHLLLLPGETLENAIMNIYIIILLLYQVQVQQQQLHLHLLLLPGKKLENAIIMNVY